jgi:hypothetical protein
MWRREEQKGGFNCHSELHELPATKYLEKAPAFTFHRHHFCALHHPMVLAKIIKKNKSAADIRVLQQRK